MTTRLPELGLGSAAGASDESEPFGGASNEARGELMKAHCTVCHQDYEHPSILAYFYKEPDHPFAVLKEPMIQK